MQVNSLSCEKAIQGTQVSKFRRIDEAMLKTVIHLMVEDVFAAFGASEKVSTAEVKRITSKILTSYWWLKIEELAYVFNKGKRMEYGKVYPIPTEANFYDWINQYDQSERTPQCDLIAREESDSLKMLNRLDEAGVKELYEKATEVKNVEPFPDETLRTSERFKADKTKDLIKEEQFRKEREEYFKNRKSDAP